jgi:hypothetical protein
MLRRVLAHLAVALTVGGAVALAAACGTDAVGIEACKSIESARCRQAPNCPNNISLGLPVHTDNGGDVNACISYYNDACLHGLAVADPGAPTVKGCVDAINAAVSQGNCDVLVHPEHAAACAWLIPPATPDASDEPDVAADAAVDAATD